MGIQTLFTPAANFSGFIENYQPELTPELVHKASIDVDEGGSTAAAKTELILAENGTQYVEFNCNRPFVFVIYDGQTEEILFAGTYFGPK